MTAWICVLSPSPKETREFIESLELPRNPKIKVLLTLETVFDTSDYLQNSFTHILELVNYFTALKKTPPIVITDFDFDFFLTQIRTDPDVHVQLLKLLETFCSNFQTSLGPAHVSEYIVLNDLFEQSTTNKSQTEPKDYMKMYVKEHLLKIDPKKITYVDKTLCGRSAAKTVIFNTLMRLIRK